MMVDVDSSEATMLERLRDAIVGDPPRAARLAAIGHPDAFVAAVRAEAATAGIDLASATIAGATGRCDILGLARFALPAATRTDWPPADWLPVAVVDGRDGPVVEWLHFAGRRLTDPFFEDGVRRARQLPINRLVPVRTPLARFADAMPADAACMPSGFVFHLSRCGSTLVAQMLAAVAGHVVVSEAPPLDTIVQHAATGDAERSVAVAQLRAMVAALLRDRHGDRRHAVVKLDCWHMLAFDLIAEAFPDVPCIFLYRDPAEILVSHARRPGSQMVPGLMPHLAEGADDAADPAGFGARLLGRIADAAADAVATGRVMAVRYDSLPDAVFDRILPHFGIAVSDDDRATMAAAGLRDAKMPGTPFTDDRAAKQAEATSPQRARAAAHLEPAVARLDAAGMAR